MKTSLFALLALAVAGCGKKSTMTPSAPNTKRTKTDVEFDGFRWRVKSVKHSEFTIIEKFGNPVRGKERIQQICKYDEKGNILERTEYNPSGGGVPHKYISKYDEKLGRVVSAYFPNGELASKITYKFDGKGNISERVEDVYSYGKIFEKVVCKYDKKGNILERTEYVGSGEINFKRTYRYDKRGNLVESVLYDGNGKLDHKTTYKYDGKGNRVEEVDSGNFTSKTTYKYNEKGRRVEEVVYTDTSGEIRLKFTFKYDEQGNKTEEMAYIGNEALFDGDEIRLVKLEELRVSAKGIFKYDGKGNRVKETYYELKTDFGNSRFVPTQEKTWEFTYWD